MKRQHSKQRHEDITVKMNNSITENTVQDNTGKGKKRNGRTFSARQQIITETQRKTDNERCRRPIQRQQGIMLEFICKQLNQPQRNTDQNTINLKLLIFNAGYDILCITEKVGIVAIRRESISISKIIRKERHHSQYGKNAVTQ